MQVCVRGREDLTQHAIVPWIHYQSLINELERYGIRGLYCNG